LARAVESKSKPNVLYILADDLGWGDIDAYNEHSAVPTPNCSRFATQGMRFTDMHASSAVCTPSRYSILTVPLLLAFTAEEGCAERRFSDVD
jgi:arylsulfatase A